MKRPPKAIIIAACCASLIKVPLGFCETSLQAFSDTQLETLAAESYNRGNPGSAGIYLDELIRRNPGNLAARNSRGRMRFDLQQLTPALDDLSFVVSKLDNGETWPGVSLDHVLHRRANALLDLNRLAEGLADIERALTLNPSYDSAWNTRGLILSDMGRAPEALAAFERGLQVNPRHLPLRINVINLALKENEHELAISRCEESRDVAAVSEASLVNGTLDADSLAHRVPVNPIPSLLFWNCALAYKRSDNQEKAAEFFGLAASAPARVAKDFLYRAQAKHELAQHEAALADYGEALSRDGSLLTAHQGRSDLLMQLQRYEDARKSFVEYADRFPEDPRPIHGQASALLHLERTDDALPLAEQAAARAPQNADFLSTLSWIHLQQQHPEKAEAALRTVLEHSPEHAYANQLLVHTLMVTKQYEAALQVMSQLEAKRAKLNPHFAKTRAQCLVELKRFDESLEVLNQALAQNPKDVDLLVYRSWIYRVRGNAEAAVNDISRAAELDPYDPQIKKYQREYDQFRSRKSAAGHVRALSAGFFAGRIMAEAMKGAFRKGKS